jgi:chromate reductase, NAD(P)H dehydrogenase (quinone)
MNASMTILGISGSLRKGSFNTMALKAARELAPKGAKMELFDLSGIPLYNQDEEKNLPSRVAEFKSRIRAADAILFVTPEYNYSIPGVLKNAIDWASRPYGDNAWDGKPVAVMGASPSVLGTARAQYHLRQCFVFLNMYALNTPEVMISKAQERFDAQGTLTDQETQRRISELLDRLVQWTMQIRTKASLEQTAAAQK